jgi:hypothetical protein
VNLVSKSKIWRLLWILNQGRRNIIMSEFEYSNKSDDLILWIKKEISSGKSLTQSSIPSRVPSNVPSLVTSKSLIVFLLHAFHHVFHQRFLTSDNWCFDNCLFNYFYSIVFDGRPKRGQHARRAANRGAV